MSLPTDAGGSGADRRTIGRHGQRRAQRMSAEESATGQPGGEAEQLLARLIRFNTVNPPGNERPAQEYLAEHLRAAGFECELLGAEQERPNLLARLRADGARESADGPTLCYLGHVDTVLANPEEWTHDPWA